MERSNQKLWNRFVRHPTNLQSQTRYHIHKNLTYNEKHTSYKTLENTFLQNCMFYLHINFLLIILIFSPDHYWNLQFESCLPCTRCHSLGLLTLRGCAPNKDVVCGTMQDFQKQMEQQVKPKITTFKFLRKVYKYHNTGKDP
jgi:hypothetical protein